MYRKLGMKVVGEEQIEEAPEAEMALSLKESRENT